MIWSILCRDVIVDRSTNNLSLFNVIEEMLIAGQPPVAPQQPSDIRQSLHVPAELVLVTLWTRSNEDIPERGTGRLKIMLPGNDSVLGPEFEVDLTKYLRLRNILNLPGLPVVGAGTYRFIIEDKANSEQWVPMFELPLRVVLATQDSS